MLSWYHYDCLKIPVDESLWLLLSFNIEVVTHHVSDTMIVYATSYHTDLRISQHYMAANSFLQGDVKLPFSIGRSAIHKFKYCGL
jgi:hypothetical protein